MSTHEHTRKIIDDFAAQRPIRAGSFIITLYGDAILPRNGDVWMGDIILFCEQIGISESLVRTAVSRLVSSNRLQGTKLGRKSYYHLTDASKIEFKHASNRIYSRQSDHKDVWTFVMNLSSSKREDLKRKMDRIGFGDPVNGLFMKPGNCQAELKFSLGDYLKDNPHVAYTARIEDAVETIGDVNLLAQGWRLDVLSEQYATFCRTFKQLHETVIKKGDLDIPDKDQLMLRQILVHGYRRIIFKDPCLPEEFLPENWQGLEATGMFADLYAALLPKSEAFIDGNFDMESGKLQSNPSVFEKRLQALSVR